MSRVFATQRAIQQWSSCQMRIHRYVAISWKLLIVGMLITSSGVALAQSPPAQPKPSRIWKSAPDGVEVLAATFLGGSGTEWLAAGGFQPDGSVIVVGNVLGSTFDLKVKIGVIGTDLPAPKDPQPVPVLDRLKPKVDKEGKPILEKPSWRHEGTTAFVAHYSADLKQLITVHRFPWTAGVATAMAVGPDGSIYLAGRATDQIDKIGGDIGELPAMKAAEKLDPRTVRCDHAFIAKLARDGSKAIWMRHVRGACAAPTVTWVNGKVQFGAAQRYTIDDAGKLLDTVIVPGGVSTTSSVNPVDKTIAVGGEHHWKTGREPWRCPTLNIYNIDGALKHRFYDWGGPYVGLDNCRQVSDTAVRYVAHDPDGGILMYLWSDGGNSVACSQPYDVRQGVGLPGLGMTSAGAGVLSAAYLIRLDPKEYRVTDWTLWLANNPKGKPNSIWIEQMARTTDGSLAIAGKSAWGVWQTKDKLTDAEPEGEFLAVLSEDFTGLRFSSVIPGVGVAELNDGAANRGSGWGIGTGTVAGKSRVLFLAGASAGRTEDNKLVATPTRNAAQEKFGGGRCDGYVVLLGLATPTRRLPIKEANFSVAGPTRASFERIIRDRNHRGPPKLPADGAEYHFLGKYPSWVTVDAEIRDQSGKLWPGFMYGKPVEGTLLYRDAGSEGKFSVTCDAVCQPDGDPKRRILGELLKDPKNPPPLTLTVQSLGALKRMDKTVVEKGVATTLTVEYYEAKGTLEFGGKKLEVIPKIMLRFDGTKDDPTNTVRATAYLALKASELGLTKPEPNGLIDLLINMSGTTRTQAPKTK